MVRYERWVRRAQIAAAILFWPAIAVVIWGELKPSTQGPEGWDKVLHFSAYFGLAGIATAGLGRVRPAIWAALALAAFGGILEIVQGFVDRDAEWGDELANTIGAGAGLAVGLLTIQLLRRLAAAGARGESGG